MFGHVIMFGETCQHVHGQMSTWSWETVIRFILNMLTFRKWQIFKIVALGDNLEPAPPKKKGESAFLRKLKESNQASAAAGEQGGRSLEEAVPCWCQPTHFGR